MKLHVRSTALAVLLLLNASQSFGASSDLACKEVPVSIYYSKAYQVNSVNQYVYYNGASAINITSSFGPFGSVGTVKQLKAVTTKFSSVSVDSNKSKIVFGSSVVSNTDSAYAFVDVLKDSSVDVGIYYAGYLDANGTQQYVYFNGASVINVTPPSGATAKKLTALTSQFATLPTVSQSGTLVFSALSGQICESSQGDQTIDLTNGLVAHYEFEDNANDSSGNEINGNAYGTISYVDGKIGRSVYFDGNGSSYISGDASEFPSGNSDRTVCLWAKSEDKLETTTPNFAFIWAMEAGVPNSYGIQEDNAPWITSNGEWYTFLQGGTTEIPEDINTNVVVSGEWQHICSVYDAGTVKSYVDNNLTNSVNVELNTGTGTFNIGGIGGSYSFKGYIDDIRVYNRVLNEAEIETLKYNVPPDKPDV